MLQDREGRLSIASAPFNLVGKLVGRHRIKASQILDGIQGGCPIAREVVSDPEIVTGVGILWINAHGLPLGLDGVVVALEFVVNETEVEPGQSIFRFVFRPFLGPSE